jgi:ring-1,2-phenylacetyl-CoA epoxidase subunit PaaD
MVTREQRAVAATVASAEASSPPPSLAAIWNALNGVPDPEIPAVSVVELGIIRGVEWEAATTDRAGGDTLVVAVTPTYSGCPATELIMAGIREALAALGVPRVRLDVRLAPAWTTDWIAPEGKRKLRAYGIAPPTGDAPASGRVDVAGISPLRRAAVIVPCPRCGATNTRLVSQFGSTACKAHYRCEACLEPFDYFKPH